MGIIKSEVSREKTNHNTKPPKPAFLITHSTLETPFLSRSFATGPGLVLKRLFQDYHGRDFRSILRLKDSFPSARTPEEEEEEQTHARGSVCCPTRNNG